MQVNGCSFKMRPSLSRFKEQSDAAVEQPEAAQQDGADAGTLKSQKSANPLLGIVTSQRDRFRARCPASYSFLALQTLGVGF